MKTIVSALLVLCFLASCNTPPENYEKGLTHMSEKKWDKAIESFNLLTEEDKEWLDSAAEKKQLAFNNLISSLDWKKTFRVLEKNQDDDDFMFAATDNIENFFARYIKMGKADSALVLADENKAKLEEFIDTIFTTKIIKLCEDSIFSGTWSGLGSLSGQQIYFKRDGDEFHAYSNHSKSGWTKDGIIYKKIAFTGNNTWKINPKIFQTDYWGSSSTYYSKKGKLKVLSSDTLEIDYESLGSEDLFVRDK